MTTIKEVNKISEIAEVMVEYDDLGFVKEYVCPSCGNKVKLHHQDDIDTKWFKCEKCGKQSRKLKSAKLQQLQNHLKNLEREISLAELDTILDSTVKYDSPNRKITFLMTLLNYTEEDQANLAYNAESSTGKSYIPLEIVWYFPQEDVMYIAYSSPTSFFHEYGEWLKEEKQKLINLHQKILVFVDQPHDLLLQRLRPLLSHDRKELIYKITDRRQKSGLRTKTIRLIGYPSVLFCSAKFNMHQQERTRLLLLSPETTQEKIRAGILLRIEKESDRHKFKEWMEKEPQRVWLQERVESIKTWQVRSIIITEEDRETITERFFKLHKHLIPRHQRDISRLLGLIKAHTLLNCFTREKVDKTGSIIVNKKDIEAGFNLYLAVSEANELGLPPAIYDIFQALNGTIGEIGVTRQEFAKHYFKTFHRPVGSKRLTEILRILDSCGLIQEEPDPTDKRRKLIFIQKIQVTGDGNNTALHGKLNTPAGGGIPKNAYPQVKGYLILLEDLVSVHWVDEPLAEHECGVCGYVRETIHKAVTNKEDQVWVCESCVQDFEAKRKVT